MAGEVRKVLTDRADMFRPGIRLTRLQRLRGAAKGTDRVLLSAVLLLATIGMVSVYAATRNHLLMIGRPGTSYLTRDLLNLAVGTLLATPVALMDYRQLRSWAPVLYGGTLLCLLAVLTPIGSSINGAHGWFSLGPVQLEPSEFAKLSVILLLSTVLSERRDRELAPSRADIWFALLAGGLPLLLVLAEPALGIAIVLAVIVLVVLSLSGAPARWTLGLMSAGVILGAAALSLHLLKPYQQERFTYFADPRGAHTSTGYQIEQSRIAIGSGRLTGQGILAGSQTDGGFIPEQQTDFIFTVSAEEGGLLAGSVLLGALGVVFYRGLGIAAAAKDHFGQLVAVGIVGWLAFQSFVNIGMTLGIMPVTGLPLPFVSYGGSSLLADLLAVALLISIRRVARNS
jgi:rod shape determining protein RodA